MLTISKPLSASQARTYHAHEFASQQQNYWSRDQQGHSEWQGRLAQGWNLSGVVEAEHFARLSEGLHPHTDMQLVRHQVSRTYEGKFGREVTSAEHRAGWDATFSAPKSVSLTALVGGDDRVREAHRESVRVALAELEPYTQARIGNVHVPETTGKFIAATFEHDTARPVAGYAAPPFAQLQEAGMKTVRLDEIVRQKDPELKQVVEQLARGEVEKAVQNLDRQGCVHEIQGHDDRVTVIAKEYAKSPENALVVSPDNRSRMEINERIHTELQSRGMVSADEHRIRTLLPRQDMTGADRTWAERYEVGDMLRYSRTSKETGIGKGEYAQVKSIDAPNNRLTVELQNGTERTYDPRRQQGVYVYREELRRFSVGDRIQFTAPANDLRVANRELGTIERINGDGRLHLKLDSGRAIELDPHRHLHLDYGYAMTSYSSQGQTADRVLIHVDTELGAKDLLNSRMAYVAVSRGAYDAQIYTNDREMLPQALGHDVSRQSAHVPAIQQEPMAQKIEPQPAHTNRISRDFGFGL